jgi:coenzyme F420-reducing hydrogenase beta subunit
MSISACLEKFLNKKFSNQDVQEQMGSALKSYLAYYNDDSVRENAASGGVVSGILIELLKNKTIDGALVCYTQVINNKVTAIYKIAETIDEITKASGSKYVESSFAKDAWPLIDKYKGNLAIVALPCDLTFLKHKINKNKNLKNKIIISIALLCGHNSNSILINTLTKKLAKGKDTPLQKYTFRKGHWRGQLEANFEDGSTITKPFSYFSIYQNLFFFPCSKCLYCNDHFGFDADISVGDVWSYDLKQSNIKTCGITLKNKKVLKLLDKTLQSSAFTINTIDHLKILEGQKRSAPFHFNISARHKAGKLFSIKIPDKVGKKVKWHEYLCAVIVLFNWRWSKSKKYSKLIFKMPRIILKCYLYLFKGLESLK